MVGSMAGEMGFPAGSPAYPSKKDRRKRPAEVLEADLQDKLQASKRAQLTDGRQGGPDAIRKHIRRIHDIQSSLHQCSIASSDPTSLLPSYEHLLQNATGEYCATRRLAARFIPRFLHLFPHCVDAAALALINIYSAKHPARDDLPAIVEAGQLDALHGLEVVLDIAYKLVDKAIPTVLRLVDFQLKLITASTNVGDVQSKERQQQQQPQTHAAVGSLLRKPDPDTLQRLIRRTFELFPRVPISVCLQALRGQDRVMCASAVWLLTQQLLKDDTASLAPDAGAAALTNKDVDSKDVDNKSMPIAASKSGVQVKAEPVAGDSQGMGQQAKPAARVESMAAVVAPQHCLARAVLTALPDTQQWLFAAIASITRDKHAQLSKETSVLVRQLLSLAAAPAAPTPTKAQANGNARVPAKTKGHLPSTKQVAAGQGSTAHFVLQPPAAQAVAGPTSQVVARHAEQAAPLRTNTPDTQQPPGGTDMVISSPGPVPDFAQPLTPLALAGGPVTRADCCLYISQLPPGLSPANLQLECESDRVKAKVDSVHLGPAAHLPVGHALVVFKTVQDAAFCFQAMADTPVWVAGHPVRCDFCPGLPAECPMRMQEGPSRPASPWIWCAQVASAEEIYAAIQAAGLTVPKAVLRVAGNKPGCLLHMPDAACVQSIVEFVLGRFLPQLQPPPFILPPALQQQHSTPVPPLQQTYVAPPQAAGQDMNLQQAPSLHTSGSLPFTPAGVSAQQQQQPQQQPGLQGSGVQLHQGMRSLWVTQLPDNISEELLVSAFGRFGKVVGCQMMRPSRGALLDFMTHAKAAEAQRAMHNSNLGNNVLRVEWKFDSRPQQQQHMPHTPTAGLVTRNSTPAHPGFTPTPTPSPYTQQHQPPNYTPSTGTAQAGACGPRSHPHNVYANQVAPAVGRRPSFTTQQAETTPTSMQPPPPPPPAHAQQQQTTPRLFPSRSVPTIPTQTWQGVLAKSGGHLCSIKCMPAETSGPSAPEPNQWPDVLDVRNRLPIEHAAAAWSSTPAEQRAARHLLPASPEDTQALANFVRYLVGKKRAGVIKLEATGRTIYIVPPSREFASMLGMSYDQERDAAALLAVIIPIPAAR